MTIVEDRPAAGYEAARKAMIESQLRPSGVNAAFVLRRMGEVPRERFVPPALQAFAYVDRALPLDKGGWLASPLVNGMILQEAAPQQTDAALLVDGGSGYMAELVRPLVGSLEVVDPSAGASGRVSGQGFTLLIIDGAVERVPDQLVARLAPDARIVTGLAAEGVTSLAEGRVAGGTAALVPVAEMGMPVMPEFAAPKQWKF